MQFCCHSFPVCFLWEAATLLINMISKAGTEDDTADSTNVTIVTGEGIDVSMYESARVFPGLVDTLVDNTVNTLLAL